MKIFLDTSSLLKLYHRETDTAELESKLSRVAISELFLSELTKIEFASAVWKKVRTKEISEARAKITLSLFEADFEKYTFIAIDSLVVEQARLLIAKYGVQGLRTLDSIQLASAVLLAQNVSIFFTSDRLLDSFLIAEGLPTGISATNLDF